MKGCHVAMIQEARSSSFLKAEPELKSSSLGKTSFFDLLHGKIRHFCNFTPIFPNERLESEIKILLRENNFMDEEKIKDDRYQNPNIFKNNIKS